ncbi:MAG TPA: choice-of-anchor O protein [Anaerolineae bacterium]|nr:choice-of-anchor O protein [Anaerolineae bacterium]HQI85972.1 choice-of-anchor O protein [Anaerolineae bacterium]
MKSRRIRSFLVVLVLLSLTSQFAFAEDGILFRRNVSGTPDAETEQAALFMMDFYVPAQSAAGVVGPVSNYILADGTTVGYEPRYYAKPLISAYIDDIGVHVGEEEEEVSTFGHVAIGAFDAFVGVSLDDGTTWRTTNLSRASDLSSFTLANGHEYPGDAFKVVHQVFNDNILVAWASRYCAGGAPLFTLDPVEDATYLTDLETNYGKDALYLYDLFGVGGTQRSVDYTLQGFPEVGELPYGCIWAARGKLLAGDDPSTADATEATYVMWTKPERLTSGVRDAMLPQLDCAAGAGCAVIWQEDPEGLRPGLGLGPGEGWSGAITNGQTDMWYSYIKEEDFDIVFADDTLNTDTEVRMAEFQGTTQPKPYVPMSMPIRMTDNAMCKYNKDTDPYCYINFSKIGEYDHTNITELQGLTAPQENATFCTGSVSWTNPGGTTLEICKTQDGRVLNGRVGASRVRLNTKGYDSDKDGIADHAWVIAGAEETKALGDLLVDPWGNPTEDPLDVGKDMFYYTFDLFNPPMLEQGLQVNQPSVCSPFVPSPSFECTPYELYPVQTDPLNGGEFYLTDITRRFALTTNSVKDVVESNSHLATILFVKNGIINQGGPADIFLQRFAAPAPCVDADGDGTWDVEGCFDPAVDNPYDYKNLDCDEWKYTDGSNPNYLHGLCMSQPINVSGTTIVECESATGNDNCASLFPSFDDGSTIDPDAKFEKVLEWRNCDGVTDVPGCEPGESDLDDYNWENPYDVAKGHRGFLDGDIVMVMYAWSPNWHANSVGNDHYNLYIRRSFDGGLTWTTTPAELGGTGTSFYENYCVMTAADDCVGTLWEYGPGEFEQARNVSQLIGNKVTILDPRYTPTGGLKLYPKIKTSWLTNNGFSFEGLPYDDDLARDKSKFFVIYETGDNTTVDVGEAVPLDLFYSRATTYGDTWELMDYKTEEDDALIDRWPWAEKDAEDLSGEAAMLANPGGTFMYTVWNQWREEVLPDGEELVYDSDMIFRRMMYLPDDSTLEIEPTASILYVSATTVSQLDGDILTLAGTARDLDVVGEGIVAYKWTSDLDGVVGNEQVLKIPAAALSRGRHTFTFSALDGEGQWSRSATVTVNVVQQIYRVMLPIVMRSK